MNCEIKGGNFPVAICKMGAGEAIPGEKMTIELLHLNKK
jgi:hypothetical protein